MTDQLPIGELIRRVREGDEEAAAELVRQYEPMIRREVRLRLKDRRLRRVLDSMDVCQSVLASFFVRAAAGQYELERPGQLARLLVSIARNKVVSTARRHYRQRRDDRRVVEESGALLGGVADDSPGPSELVACADLLRAFRAGLAEEERQLADLRAEGLAWDEIAARVGGTAQARRIQYARAVDRVSRTLGLDEEGLDEA